MGSQEAESQVVWFDIPCKDLDRAIGFYSAVLGCEIQKEEAPGFALGILPHGGTAIGGCLVVGTGDNSPSAHGVLIYLNCNGRLDEAIAATASNGGQVLLAKESIGPHGFRAIILDSEGNRVALHSM
jgi:predicted enzyme related to lactoylglutathione lyase